MEKVVMIKYGELTTKKGNRRHFINVLARNIKNKLKNIDYKISSLHDRMYIFTNDSNLSYVISEVKDVFGIHSIMIAEKVETNYEVIKERSLKLISDKKFKTFKVETKRSYKKFPIKSMSVSREIGGIILKNINDISVDVKNPELLLKIEIRKDFSYIYFDEIKGLGGYPVGVQNKGLLMLSGGIDSPVSGYLAMKRGIDIDCLYFESLPHTSIEARNKVIELSKIINKYSGNINFLIVPFTKMQEAIYKNCNHNYMITIMRRMMYRISSLVAEKRNCLVLVNGESVGQVASQTLSSMSVINEVTNIPVIRPVVCMDKIEIIDIAKKIKTYETSILPFEDCCTIFLPKHPVINPSLKKCLDYENNFNFEELVKECVDNVISVDINDITNKYDDLF